MRKEKTVYLFHKHSPQQQLNCQITPIEGLQKTWIWSAWFQTCFSSTSSETVDASVEITDETISLRSLFILNCTLVSYMYCI